MAGQQEDISRKKPELTLLSAGKLMRPNHKIFIVRNHWSGSSPLAHHHRWTLTQTPLEYSAIAPSHGDPTDVTLQDQSFHTLQQGNKNLLSKNDLWEQNSEQRARLFYFCSAHLWAKGCPPRSLTSTTIASRHQ